MPVSTNIQVYPNSDFTIQTQVVPIVPIGSWNIQFQVMKRFFGVSGLITLSTASGYSNYNSGMSIINSGTGIFAAKVSGGALSGWNGGAYSFSFSRQGSGVASLISEGYLVYNY